MAETNPTLDEVLQQAIRGALAGVHIGFVARVVSYDSVKQTVNLQPVVRGRRRLETGEVQTYQLPQLVGVPVEWPQGTGYSLTWPLQAGDEGLVRVMERSHDEWKATGNGDCTPQHARRFDLSDATFYPGAASPASPLPASAYDAAAMVLGASALKIGSSSAIQAFVLGTAFKTLYNSHTHATPAGPSGPPAVLMDAVPGTHLSSKIKGE